MSDSPYDVDGALKWAETSKEMNKGTNPAELENAMDYVALQTLADEVRKHRFIPVTERLPTEHDGSYIDEEHTSIDVLCETDQGTRIVAIYRFDDKQFFYDTKITMDVINITQNIIAWQPLPEA
jgi:hypothetical protein